MNKIACLFIIVIFLATACATEPFPVKAFGDIPEAFTALEKKLPPDTDKTIFSGNTPPLGGRAHEPDASMLVKSRNDLIELAEQAILSLKTTMNTVNTLILAAREAAARNARTQPAVTPAPITSTTATTRTGTDQTARPPVVSSQAATSQQQTRNAAEETAVTASLEAQGEPGILKTVWAKRGDVVEISLDGRGWILLEAPKKEDGLEYISNSTDEGKSVFRLRGKSVGRFLLPFQLQDQASGMLKKEIIEVAVVEDAEFARIMEQGIRDRGQTRTRELDDAYGLFQRRQYDEALNRFLAIYQENDPVLNDTIANIYFMRKDYDNAMRYWKKNLSYNNSQRENALLGISRSLREQKNLQGLVAHARLLLAEKRLSLQKEFLELARYFIAVGQNLIALDILNEWLLRYPYASGIDEVYYLLARMYEDVAEIRDFRKSEDFYTIVVKQFPESRYAEISQARIDYIDRYYIKVR